MRSQPAQSLVHSLVPFALLVVIGCSSAGVESLDSGRRPEANVVAKGGLGNSPVAVAPFLDGVFPQTTPNWTGSSQWTVVPAFPSLDLTDTLVIASNPTDDKI